MALNRQLKNRSDPPTKKKTKAEKKKTIKEGPAHTRVYVEFCIFDDEHPEGIGWSIESQNGAMLDGRQEGYYKDLTPGRCVEEHVHLDPGAFYRFSITDAWGDGIGNGEQYGYYGVFYYPGGPEGNFDNKAYLLEGDGDIGYGGRDEFFLPVVEPADEIRVLLEFCIFHDDFPEDIGWSFYQDGDIVDGWPEGYYKDLAWGRCVEEQVYLDPGVYTFTITDAWGDGIGNGKGYYGLFFFQENQKATMMTRSGFLREIVILALVKALHSQLALTILVDEHDWLSLPYISKSVLIWY